MAAITDLSDLVNRMTGGNSGTPENIFFFKYPQIDDTVVDWDSDSYFSTWRLDGYPTAGATPTTVAAPTNSTQGAFPITNPGGGREKWLVQAHVGGVVTSTSGMILCDRLLHIGGLDGTVTTSQTVGGTLTRYTGGVGNQIWAEIYADVGTTARTLTVTYTNQAGTGSRTGTCTFGGTKANELGTIVPVTLQDGDTGVQAVASCQLDVSTGTAGDFGITVVHPLAMIGHGPGMSGRDFTVGPGGMPEIQTNACLFGILPVIGSVESSIQGMIATVEA